MGDRLLRQCYMILAFGMICWIGSYHITGKKGKRSGYGYEYEQAVAGTGLGMPIVKNSLM